MKIVPLLCLLLLLAADVRASVNMSNPIDLSGQWEFRIDPDDVGQSRQFFNLPFEKTIRLPGSMAENGLGHDVSVNTEWTGGIIDKSWFTAAKYERYRKPGNVKVPFWLTPVKWYVGPAWYRRTIEIPEAWRGRHVILSLERPHWVTSVWLDGIIQGMRDSLQTPHEYDLGELSPGRHVLTIRVDNRMHLDVGQDAHSVSDHTQTNWNGIVGRIELRARNKVWIGDLQIYPDVSKRRIRVVGMARNATGRPFSGHVELRVESVSKAESLPLTMDGEEARFEAELALGSAAPLWDEFSPSLMQLTAALDGDIRTIEFGLREFKTRGTQFALNGRPVFLRGTLECCIFPLTGYPPTDVDSWTRILAIARAHGLNHLRFHSYCPPEAAFEAADRMGFILSIECGAWAVVGEGKPQDKWLYEEADRILRQYGNHPSFCMMLYGNEPHGKTELRDKWLGEFVAHFRNKDPRRLYSSGSGWPVIPANDYHTESEPRIQHWGEGLKSRINSRPPETTTDYSAFISKFDRPMVSHEIGQWCAYPNLDEIRKYTGVTRAGNFEIFRDSLAEHHMLDQARDFLLASGKLQALCYKEDIESALRTRGMAGFQLLDLHDFPGQGTALVGVLDAFWDSKGYITADEYRRFACETVPLARLSKRVYTQDETLRASVEIAHFGPVPIENARPRWTLVSDAGVVVAGGSLPSLTIPIANGTPLGSIEAPLHNAPAPAKLVLTVALSGTSYSNSWDIWVYPTDNQTQAGEEVLVTQSVSEALTALQKGAKVLLVVRAGAVKGDELGRVELGFSPIFWNTAWTSRQAPHTLGILCDPAHPAMADFPTEFHTNWQWWELIHSAQALILDTLGPKHRPIVQVIDDWVTNRKLGLLVEARVGAGRLMICSMDLHSDLASRPVARQMRSSVLAYMDGRDFAPTHELTAEGLKAILDMR